MSERSGQFGIVEQSALAVASVLVLFGAVGIWQGAHGAADAGRDFALINVLLAGVVLAIGTLAASAYRSRSQIDIDRLEEAAMKVHDNVSKFNNVKTLLIEANKLNEQAKQIGEAYSEMKNELGKIGGYANAAVTSQDSIQALTAELRKMFQADELRRIAVGGAAAAQVMTQWELGNERWNSDRSTKALARAGFYQMLKETVLVDGELYPTPSEGGWVECPGEFVDSESDQQPGTIVEVASYQWKSASHGRTVGKVAGMKSIGVRFHTPAGNSGETAAVASSTAGISSGVPVDGALEGKSVETSTKIDVSSNEETKV